MVLVSNAHPLDVSANKRPACIFGSCIICIDFLVRLFPGKEKFEIRRSDTFLSSSLSLSFGVMLFSALYSMLPEAKTALMDGGKSKSAASWILIGCFLGGVVGIQLLSRLFHHFIPSHVVDCEHSHDQEAEAETHPNSHDHGTVLGHEHNHNTANDTQSRFTDVRVLDQAKRPLNHLTKLPSETDALLGRSRRRPAPLRSRVTSFLSPAKDACDEQGPCKGFTDPCGKECFMNKAASPAMPSASFSTPPKVVRASAEVSSPSHEARRPTDSARLHDGADDNAQDDFASGSTATSSRPGTPDVEHGLQESHHHHVPDNAFLSIGLQTSLAIALHKLPEGFITYATNHANPQLGFSVFVALFIHNITEGFALALPLFLAINSRWKAILAASILGGASQPIGAGIAELWFQAANQRGMKPDETVYGCMFAITSGIMTSVALQLFSESLGMTHNKTLCIAWAFVGMGILGVSMSLTA